MDANSFDMVDERGKILDFFLSGLMSLIPL